MRSLRLSWDAMADDTETLDLPGEVRKSLSLRDAGLILVAHDGPAPQRVVQIPASPLFIGRAPPYGHLAIAQSAVSKLHAEIVHTPDGVQIRDLDSRNGVVVNGERVTRALLQPDDLVHVGNVLYLFVEQDVARFDRVTQPPAGFEAIVAGPRLRDTIEELAIVAKADLSVLLLGETGVGKEVFARAIHSASGRRGRFVALNCAALPPALLEAELFGVKRGAFTGAERDREGLFRAADGGTLVLDEIGEMPLEAQAKVLRCIATKEVVSLGATTAIKSDARFVCATHRDLQQLCQEGRFRADLLGRIRQQTTTFPPIRERREDILALVRFFLRAAGRPDLSPNFRAEVLLTLYDWPFNVREIEAFAQRAAVLVKGTTLSDSHLPPEIRALEKHYGKAAAGRPVAPARVSADTATPTAAAPSEAELRELLARYQGNVAALARHYGKDRAQVHRWFRRLGLVPEDFRGT